MDHFRTLLVTLYSIVLVSASTSVSGNYLTCGSHDKDKSTSICTPPIAESYLPLRLPTAISLEELVEYCNVVHLSEAQLNVVEQLHLQYLKAERDVRKTHLPELWELSVSAAKWGAPWRAGPEAIDDHERFYRARERIARLIQAIESQLFNDIQAILVNEQIERWARAEMMRERVVAGRTFFSAFPAATVDLSIIVRAMLDEGVIQSLGESFEKTLFEYESRITPMWSALARDTMRSAQRSASMIAAGNYGDVRRARLTVLGYQRSMTDLNLHYIDRLMEAVDMQSATELRRRFNEIAFWGVYPDPFDVSQLIHWAIESIAEDDDPHGSIEALENIDYAFRSEQERLNAKMVAVQLREDRRVQRTNHRARHPDEEYRSELRELQHKRAENALKSLNALKTVFDSELPPQVQNGIDQFKERVCTDRNARELGHAYRPAPATSMLQVRGESSCR